MQATSCMTALASPFIVSSQVVAIELKVRTPIIFRGDYSVLRIRLQLMQYTYTCILYIYMYDK